MTEPGAIFQIAIVGSGPSGFYAAEALMRSGVEAQIDMFERLPTPYGLVRSGVAPDHQKLKQPIMVFERIARSPNFRFIGNVEIGTDVPVEKVRDAYDAVIFACGAQNDRRMGIPGEDLRGSHTATEFVGWYNGHPDFRDRTFNLDEEVVAIVGQGNVAIDVCRILTKSVDELKTSDIAEHALEELARSRVREVHIIGRRGPVQAKFTTKELRELTTLPDTVSTIDAETLQLSATCEAELKFNLPSTAAKNFEILRSLASNAPAPGKRRIHFQFLRSPTAIVGRDRVEGVRLVANVLAGEAFSQKAVSTADEHGLDCGLVFRSIGYKAVQIPGLPFDNDRGVVPNDKGRIHDNGINMPGLFVTGWLKRGPSGIIGTNRADSLETVEALLADLAKGRIKPASGLNSVLPLLETKSRRIVSLADWFDLDAAEIDRGLPAGKPREKFTRIDEMLSRLTRSP